MKDKYEQAIEREQTENDYAELFRRNRNSSLKTLILLYRGHYMELFWSVVFFVCKHSPVWILPIVTANIIDAATKRPDGAIRTIWLNAAFMIVMVLQNILKAFHQVRSLHLSPLHCQEDFLLQCQ